MTTDAPTTASRSDPVISPTGSPAGPAAVNRSGRTGSAADPPGAGCGSPGDSRADLAKIPKRYQCRPGPVDPEARPMPALADATAFGRCPGRGATIRVMRSIRIQALLRLIYG